MIRYKRIIVADTCTVIVENTSFGFFIKIKIGELLKSSKKLSDEVYNDNQRLWKCIEAYLIKYKASILLKADYVIVTTRKYEYKIQACWCGCSILYNKINCSHFRTAYIYANYDSMSVVNWISYFPAD